MVKFVADKDFKGLKEKKLFKANEPFEMTIKRAEEVQKNISEKYGVDLGMKRADEDEAKDKEEED